MKKILYLSTSYLPSRRASSIQVMRMCAALARQGHDVILLAKRPQGSADEAVDDFQYYDVSPLFSIEKAARPAYKGGGIIYNLGIWRFLWQRRHWADVVYARDLSGAWLATRLGIPTIFEAHVMPKGSLLQYQYRQIAAAHSFLRLVVISLGLKKDLADFYPLPEEKVVVAHDGAELIGEDKQLIVDEVTRANHQLQVGYVGQLYPGKGMEVILPLAGRLPDICFHVVGGAEADLRFWQEQNPAQNIRFHGFISPGEVTKLYGQFDVLLLPAQHKVYGATGQSDISRWMSPMKMFEYMAAGKPIISSNLPVLREVLEHERNALLVAPDDLEGWAAAVRRLQSEPELAARLAGQAKQDLVEKYTWEARAKRVLQGI